MRTGQRVVGVGRVIEGRERSPVGSAVARFAGRREARGRVIRIRGAGKVLLVASVAIFGQRRVVAVCVALCALYGRMRARKWEHRCVIEG